MSSSSLYGGTSGNVTVSSKNITTLYNSTASNVVTANVPDRNFTTLYGTTTAEIQPSRGYGNANVERFLNAGTDGANIVQNINMSGTIYVGGNSYLGNVGNVHIDGGTYNYVLTTDGAGNLSWTEQQGSGGGNATPYIHFDVTSTGNNQSFTDTGLEVYGNSYNMNVFKNGVNIEPFFYEKTANDTIQVNILLNDGDTLDILASSTGGGAAAGGNNFDVQFNGGGILSGVDSFQYDPVNDLMTVGNITASNVTATLFTGTLATNSQPNITSVGTLSGLTVVGESNLGPVGNVVITGGTNGYVLQTDGAGNLSWTAQTGGGGNGVPGGANTQIQFNDGGSFGGNSGFTFDKTSGNVTIPNNVTSLSSSVINSTDELVPGVLIKSLQTSAGGIRPIIKTEAFGNNYANPTSLDFNSYVFQIQGTAYNGLTRPYQPSANYAFAGDIAFHKTNEITNPSVLNYEGSFFQVVQWGNDGTNDNLYDYNLQNGVLTIGGFSPTNGFSSANTNFTVTVQNTSGVTKSLSFDNTGNLSGPNNITANYFYGDGGHLSNIQVANITGLGNIATLNLTGSSSNVLYGNGVFAAVAGGGTPGGSNTQFQYNNSGSFGGVSGLTYNGTSITANLGNLQMNQFQENVYSFGSATGTITPDFNSGSIQNLTLTGNITLNSLGNALAGRSMTLILTQDSTGGRTLTSTMKFAGGSKTLSTTPNATDIVVVFYSGTQYYASLTTGYA